jgi:hypothetical protein
MQANNQLQHFIRMCCNITASRIGPLLCSMKNIDMLDFTEKTLTAVQFVAKQQSCTSHATNIFAARKVLLLTMNCSMQPVPDAD